MPRKLDLSPEQRKARERELKKKQNQRYKEKKQQEKQQRQTEKKAALMDCLRDPDAPDALTAAVLNEKHGFSIIEGVQRGEKRVVILEHISGGCGETRYRVKETVYSFFPSRADALAYCDKAAKHMKFYF